MLLTEALADFLQYKRVDGLSKKTVDHYRNNTSSFVTFQTAQGNTLDLGGITAAHARSWIEDMRARGLSPTTTQGYVRAMKIFMRWCVAEELLDRDPLTRVKLPKAPRLAKDTLTPAQVDTLLDACDRRGVVGLRDYALLVLLFSTGIRASEVRDIAVADLDKGQQLITIRSGKGAKFRLVRYGVPVQRAVAAYLKHAERRQYDADRLFLTDDGKPFTQDGFRQIFRRLEDKTGIKCNAHKWRHSAAVQYLRGGGKLENLKAILGHSTYDMTLHYARLAGTDLVAEHRVADPARALRVRP
jgi:site-specific recombinase XerD